MKSLSLNMFLAAAAVTLAFQVATAQNPCAIDTSWSADGFVVDGTHGWHPDAMLVLPDGKLLVATTAYHESVSYVRRYHTDGSPDLTYGTNGELALAVDTVSPEIRAMAYHDGVVYIVGQGIDWAQLTNYGFVAATTVDGALIPAFDGDGIRSFNDPNTYVNTLEDVLVDSLGGIYVVGVTEYTDLLAAKLDATGNLDLSWGGDGMATIPSYASTAYYFVEDCEMDRNGQIVVTGLEFSDYTPSIPYYIQYQFLARFTTGGFADSTFGAAGVGLYQSDPLNYDVGRSVLVTSANDYVIAFETDNLNYNVGALGLLHDGSLDTGFGTNGWVKRRFSSASLGDAVCAARIAPDDHILLAGTATDTDTSLFSLLMLNPDGSPDASFGIDGLFQNEVAQFNTNIVTAMTVDLDRERIFVAGTAQTCVNHSCGPSSVASTRYTYSFGAAPVAVTAPDADGLRVYPNPVVAGSRLRVAGVTPADVVALRLTDLSGRCVHACAGAAEMELPALPAGLYILSVTTPDAVWTQKVVVR